ncbi:MAG: hypothetical protein AMJ81_09010 [Phycisphaerae bacterium SM23_33]|nr:MAG: hypothetical protein AMJ81_09010 [Phycisphaerae bacterium SM23_33]
MAVEEVSYEIRGLSAEVEFETVSSLRRALKRLLVHPLVNYGPAGLTRALLRFGKSELAAANWADPGGWESMVISYRQNCSQVADRLLIHAGTMPMALRNRKRLGSFLIARLIEQARAGPVHVLCLGGGPGWVIQDALAQTRAPARATVVDLSAEALEFGRQMAARRGLAERIRFIQANVSDLHQYLHDQANVVKMLGLCEYLPDEQIVSVAGAVREMMLDGAPMVFNSLSRAHGTDRFFRRVFGLHMIHRSPGEVCGLMHRAGFRDFAVHPEPLGVYHVIVGRRAADAGRD